MNKIKKNIYLIGFPTCGKTTIGRILAKKLKKNFIDTDEKIEKTEKNKINEIIDKKGLSYFRNREKEILKRLKNLKNSVISLGGGITLSKNNGYFLTKTGICIFLDAPFKLLKERILKNYFNRPVLYSKSEKEVIKKAKKLYLRRISNYKNANIIFKTKGKNKKDIVNELIKILKNYAIND